MKKDETTQAGKRLIIILKEGKEVEECQSSELACPVAKTAER